MQIVFTRVPSAQRQCLGMLMCGTTISHLEIKDMQPRIVPEMRVVMLATITVLDRVSTVRKLLQGLFV